MDRVRRDQGRRSASSTTSLQQRTCNRPGTPSSDEDSAGQAAVRLEAVKRHNPKSHAKLARPFPPDILPGISGDFSSPYSDSSSPSSPDYARPIPFQPLSQPTTTRKLSHRDGSAWRRNNHSQNASESITQRSVIKEHDEALGSQTRLRRKKSYTGHHGSDVGLYIDTIALQSADEDSDLYKDASLARANSPSGRLFKPYQSIAQPQRKLPISEGGHTLKEPDPNPTPPVPPSKMLHLMRVTKGQMDGDLLHRWKENAPWIEMHCWIHCESGSLRGELLDGKSGVALIRDLRGASVKAFFDGESQTGLLQVSPKDNEPSLHLRPRKQSYFNAWFAALLCWQPVIPGQHLQERPTKHQPIPASVDAGDASSTTRGTTYHENAIIKVGKCVLVDPDEFKPGYVIAICGETKQPTGRHVMKTKWTKITSILRARGELNLSSPHDSTVLANVRLSELPRSAIQRLHPSVLDADCVVAIYPQYAKSSEACSRARPIYLSYDSRESFEVWFVLLRALATPELYGANRPKSSQALDVGEILPGIDPESTSDLFRFERSLQIRVDEANFNPSSFRKVSVTNQSVTPDFATSHCDSGMDDYYGEILIDGKLRAKTSVKMQTRRPYWYETFDFLDCGGSALSNVTIRVRRQGSSKSPYEPLGNEGAHQKRSSHSQPVEWSSIRDIDSICGEASFDIQDFELNTIDNRPWPLVDESGSVVGEITFKLRHESESILMEREFDQLSGVLHNFSNNITLKIGQRVSSELSRLAECFLNIYQVSGHAGQWLMSLAEEEIDGARELSGSARLRYAKRLGSNESKVSLSSVSREELVRDMGKHATAEANLLFRGNTLLSKALDSHMRRVGQSYLEDTMGPKLREIAVDDISCEVDPSRVSPEQDMDRNWQKLLGLTEDVWDLIHRSVGKCPSELRMIFRHIRACVQDRYGDIMRSVAYSSVSGFLFLRFFCAAVLNPQLFGLINGLPKPPAQRTFVLLAKSLQGLANMTTFGNKEPWMSRMNAFLSSNRAAFKEFIEDVCSVPTDHREHSTPTYSTPLAVFQRLPQSSREGFPSLPFLIDRARSLSKLVNLWLENVNIPDNAEAAPTPSGLAGTGDLARFHALCLGLHKTNKTCLASVERAEKPTNSFAHKWISIAEHMEAVPGYYWHRQPNMASPPPTRGVSYEAETAARRRARSYPVASASVLQGNNNPNSSSHMSDSRSRSITPTSDAGRNISKRNSGDHENGSADAPYHAKDRSRRGFFHRRHKLEKRATLD